MIETFTKVIGVMKISSTPFILMTIFGGSQKFALKRKEQCGDDVPGGNFPFIVMNRGCWE